MKKKIFTLCGLLTVCALCFTAPALAAGQTVTIDTDVTGNVYGNGDPSTTIGKTYPANFFSPDNNKVIVNSTVDLNVIGGDAYSKEGSAEATGNTVSVSGTARGTGNTVTISGTANGYVFGGSAYSKIGSATATGNTVTINDGAAFGTSTDLYGGDATGDGDAFTGNKLNLNSGTNISRAGNFETVNFGDIGTAGIARLDVTPTGAADQTTPVKLNTAGSDITLTAKIIGGGGIDKRGTGTLTLTGVNDYSGSTTVSEGTLAGNIPTGTSLTVASGATYSVDVLQRVSSLSANGGTLRFNITQTPNTSVPLLTVSGGVTMTGTDISLNTPDGLNVNDYFILAAGSFNFSGLPDVTADNGDTYAITVDGVNLVATLTKLAPPPTSRRPAPAGATAARA